MTTFAPLRQQNIRKSDDDDVPAAMWRPLFRKVPALEPVSPDARPMREQMAHLTRLLQTLPATAEESALIQQAYLLCERTHGYPAIHLALEYVARLLSDAISAMHLSLTALAGMRGYPNAGTWAGALVEQQADVPSAARRFPKLDSVMRAGSPNIEFEDVECGLALAQALGLIELNVAKDGDRQPFIALAAAIRQRHSLGLLDEVHKCAVAAASQPDCAGVFIAEVARIAHAHCLELPMPWRWFVIMHQRARLRSRRGLQLETNLGEESTR
jgi:hypothetical protein